MHGMYHISLHVNGDTPSQRLVVLVMLVLVHLFGSFVSITHELLYAFPQYNVPMDDAVVAPQISNPLNPNSEYILMEFMLVSLIP